jgi:DNA-binding transcriptional LysR family regulator
MRLSLDALQVLDAIDRRGSFAAAADELHRVPSAVTYSVKQLEEALGIALFDRGGHRAVLTDAGRELLSEGRRLLRAAADLECRVQQVAKGWEAELRIAVDTVVGIDRLYGVIGEFYRENSGTRLRIGQEVLGGTWDALESGRADLAIAASGDMPAGRSFALQPLGRVEMVFVAAPFHALAREREPIASYAIQAQRAISIADSSRLLPPRTVGLLSGQDALTVPSMEAKAAALVAGLGVGWLPRWIAEREREAGRLVIREIEGTRPEGDCYVAWRAGGEGRALQWFTRRLQDPLIAAELLS